MALKKYLTLKVLNVGKADAEKFGAHGIPGRLQPGHLPVGTELTLEVGSAQEKHLLANEAIAPATQEVFEKEVKERERPPLKDEEIDGLQDMSVAELQEFAFRKHLKLESKKKDDILKEIYAAYDIQVEEE